MKKLFTKICLLAVAMVMGGASSAWAQVVTWNARNKSYAAGDELSSNTSVVSVKLGATEQSWQYNSGRAGITTYVQGTPANGGSYIIVKPVKDITFKLDTYSSMSNCNLKMYEESATTTILKDFRQKAAVSNDFGTLSAGKTYYIYGEGFKATAAAGNTSSLEYIFYKKFVATSVETYTINYVDADNNVLKTPRAATGLYGTNATATTDDMAAIDFEGSTYAYVSGNATITLGTTNSINLVFEKSAAAPTTYSINYQLSDGTAIADPVIRNGLEGDEVSVEDADVPTYITKENVKYKYVSGKTSIMLDADENKNMINLVYTEAPKYVGKVIAVDASDNILGEIATLPAVYEGDSYTYGFPQYYLNGSTLYNVPNNGGGSDYFRNVVTPVADNYEVKIRYTGSKVENVVFYTETENLPSVSVANYTNRASNGQVAHTGGVENYKAVATLTPGKYMIYTRSLNGNKDARNFNFKVGDNVVWTSNFPQGTDNRLNSEEFNVSAESTVSFASEGSSASGIDWIYIVKTGDYSVTKTLGTTGYGTFSAACNVKVPAGVTVYNTSFDGETLTATPSEEISVIPANTGVIFKAAAGAEVTFVATAEAASTVTTALAAAPNGVAGDGSTVFGLLKNKNEFAMVMTGVTLAANSAYLEVTLGDGGAEDAKAVKFVIDGDGATAANAVTEAKAEVAVKKFFKNGQLLIQTANGMVNAAGAQVK